MAYIDRIVIREDVVPVEPMKSRRSTKSFGDISIIPAFRIRGLYVER
jgi:hypothetical protein